MIFLCCYLLCVLPVMIFFFNLLCVLPAMMFLLLPVVCFVLLGEVCLLFVCFDACRIFFALMLYVLRHTVLFPVYVSLYFILELA